MLTLLNWACFDLFSLLPQKTQAQEMIPKFNSPFCAPELQTGLLLPRTCLVYMHVPNEHITLDRVEWRKRTHVARPN